MTNADPLTVSQLAKKYLDDSVKDNNKIET